MAGRGKARRARRLLALACSVVLASTAYAPCAWADGEDAGPDAAALHRAQFGVEDRTPSFNDPDHFACSATTARCTITCLDAKSCEYGASFAYEAYADPVTGSERRATALESTRIDGVPATVWGCDCSKLRPNTTYQVGFYTVYNINGSRVASAPELISFKTMGMSVPAPSVARLSSGKVSVCVGVPEHMRAKGAFKMTVYAGKKKAKAMKTTGAAKQSFSYKKKGAGKAKYKVVYAWNGSPGVSKTSKSVKAKANKATFKQSTDAYSYAYNTKTVLPLKVSYSAKGKLTAKALWVNTVLAKAQSRLKVKVTVKVDGKKVASQTFDSGKLDRMVTKKKSLVFKKAKKGADLLNGKVTWKTKLVKAY